MHGLIDLCKHNLIRIVLKHLRINCDTKKFPVKNFIHSRSSSHSIFFFFLILICCHEGIIISREVRTFKIKKCYKNFAMIFCLVHQQEHGNSKDYY